MSDYAAPTRPTHAVKNGWKEIAIGEIFQLEYGKPLDKSDRKPNGRFPVYGANGEKDRTDRFYHDKASIIVGRKGSAGEINLTEKKFWPLDVTYFVAFDEQRHDLRFLYYLLTMLDLPKLAKGVKPGINRNEVYSQRAKVPPLPEQHRIVAILDEAFTGIAIARANAEQNLKNARALFESHLQSMFACFGAGWEAKAVRDIADHSLGKMLDKNKNRGDLQPYLRNLNVRWFEFDLSNMLKMRFTSDEKAKYSIVRGDVVICEGGYPGRAAIWDKEESVFFQKALHRVRFHKPLHNRWFLYYLSLMDSSYKLKGYFTGTGIQHFTGAALARFVVPVPPDSFIKAALQKTDTVAAEIGRLESSYQRKLAALDELKQSLLARAFAGEL